MPVKQNNHRIKELPGKTFSFLFALLFFVFFKSFSQVYEYQSDAESLSIAQLNDSSEKYLSKDLKKAHFYISKAIEKSRIKQKLTAEINSTFNLARFFYRTQQYDSCLKIIDSMAVFGSEYDKKEVLAKSLKIGGIVHLKKNATAKALQYFEESLTLYKELHDTSSLAIISGNLGMIQYERGEYLKAAEYYHQAIQIFEKNNEKENVANTYNNLGNVYRNWGKLDKAMDYYQKAYEIFTGSGSKKRLSYVLNNLGIVYRKKNDFSKAIEYQKKSLKIKEELNDIKGIGSSYSSLGIIFKELEKYEQAVEYYQKAITYYEQAHYKTGTSATLNNLGLLYLETKNYEKAAENFKKSLDEGRKIDYQQVILNNYEGLANAFAGMNDYETAFSFHKKYKTLFDSLFSEEKHKQIEELKTIYETEKKEKQNQKLRHENQIQKMAATKSKYAAIGTGGAATLILIISLLLIKQNKIRTAQKTTELEQKLFRMQMNPHFFFNSLIAIQSYIYNSNPREAAQYLSEFAKLMRFILEYSGLDNISLEKEIMFLRNYLELQKIRFDHKFDYHIITDPEIHAELMEIPPMLTQPFIENALEHGISKKAGKGQIFIKFEMKNKSLHVEVRDNGIGRKKTSDATKTHK